LKNIPIAINGHKNKKADYRLNVVLTMMITRTIKARTEFSVLVTKSGKRDLKWGMELLIPSDAD